MLIDIVVVYVPRYRHGHEAHFVPPVTGIHLAALTPPGHAVRVVHQQVEPVDLDTAADLVALSFFSGFAHEAFRLADALRARGKTVVMGGPHATFWPDACLQHCDAVVTGEAEAAWPALVADAEAGRLKRRYTGASAPLTDIPRPRYDLLSDRFVVRRVLQATRGCPFSCSFCAVPGLQPGFRVRPVDDVLADVAHEEPDWTWWQRRVAWFWDDNLTAKRRWTKDLLRGMVGMDRWWLTQASIDIVRDRELLDLMEQSGCIGIFLGIESLSPGALQEAGKRQNKVAEYKDAVAALHDRGICVMAGFIAGFDHDDADDVVRMADQLQDIGIDVPFLSVLTPFKGTPLWDKLADQDRLLLDRGFGYTNGYDVAFQPARMSPLQLRDAHRALWDRAFSPRLVAGRLSRARHLRPGAAMLSTAMNGFYGKKRLMGNRPADAGARWSGDPIADSLAAALDAGPALDPSPAPASADRLAAK